jgi:hypothetical protein
MTERVRVAAPHHGGVAGTVLSRYVGAAVLLTGGIMLLPGEALAACSPAAGSNVTVTCSGVTINQGPAVGQGYGDGTQNGLTVNVQSGASVTGTTNGLDLGSNNTVNNLGTLTTNGTTSGNNAGITTQGPLTVNNSGSIGRLDPIIPGNSDTAGIDASNSLSLMVTNNAGGVIQGGTAAILGGGGTGSSPRPATAATASNTSPLPAR